MPSPRERNPAVPADLESFIEKATRKEPGDRFQSARSVLDFFGKQSEFGADLNVKTLTFVYNSGHSRQVQKLLDTIQKRASKIDGLIIR